MALKSVSTSLLLLLVAAIFSCDRLAAQASTISCYCGLRSHTPVANGDLLNLRQGETLILNCKGDPNGNYAHFSLGYDYPDTWGVYMKNESTLNYTWYIEPSRNEDVIVHGFHNENNVVLLQLKIQLHNLDSYIDRATTKPSTPLEHTTTADRESNGSNGKIIGKTDGYPTESATKVFTAVNNIEYTLYVTTTLTALLFALVVVLLIAVTVMAKMLCHRKSKELSPEDNQTGSAIHVQDDQNNGIHEESVINASSDSLSPSN